MSRQLNLRVNDEFAERLERLAKKVGRPMATVLETIGTPAIAAAEEDASFEADSLVAWEEYQLTGVHLADSAIDGMFTEALALAETVAKRAGA